jgi:hypothetical protein
MEKSYNNKQTVVVGGVQKAQHKRELNQKRERETRQDIIFQLLLLVHIIEPPPPHKKWEGRGPRSDNIDDGDNQQRGLRRDTQRIREISGS